ncbi:uncharacterized protein E0L32_001325 [Thyridium curvatum]|uniref:Cytochrome P450 n=1 Tax=Thyridium curvatum TaxID=1093900 RepID=A0A507AZA4_9PEZI|nr:uncharacterized protein E0L32_001325 [Thyridium curvatum]TPX10128.1 hypothetical protein E0L32_001325 [Thyridium curvatum]
MADSSSNISLTGQVLESLTISRVATAIFIFLTASFLVDISLKPRYPKSIPRVGYGDSYIATLKNWIGYVVYFGRWVDEGYVKYSKHDRAFVVPSAASRPQEIVVPRSQTAWMLELPDRILSTHHAHNDVLYSEYNFLGKAYSDDVFHIRVVHRNLARHLPGLIPAIQDEVHSAIDAVFGTDTVEWKSLNLWEAWLGIVPRITNRVLVGKPTCNNEEFLKSMVHFADAVVTNSFILNMFPKILHPIVGRLLQWPNWRHWNRAHQVVQSVIAQRLHDMARQAAGDPAYQDWTAPEDFITWDIRMAKAEGKPFELDPASISKRLLPVEFAAIHTTVITGHFLMMDLLASDQSLGYMDGIREETGRVLKEEGGNWTKNGLSRLLRTDSAIRESMRVSNFATSLIKRKVIAEEGITNESEGWHVPRGGFLMLNLSGVQHDPDLYENPNSYDAFRFSRAREEYEELPQSQKNSDAWMRVQKLGMVTTSDAHLAFGHGRHACPGRFFVAHELKMIMAYLLNNYEIEPLATRPQPQWIGQTIIPPLDVKIRIRRRKATV